MAFHSVWKSFCCCHGGTSFSTVLSKADAWQRINAPRSYMNAVVDKKGLAIEYY